MHKGPMGMDNGVGIDCGSGRGSGTTVIEQQLKIIIIKRMSSNKSLKENFKSNEIVQMQH